MVLAGEGSGVPRERVVAVIAALPGGREQVGSGYLVGGRLVLTAEHCTRDKASGHAALGLRVVRASDGHSIDVVEVVASPAVDIAALRLTDVPWDPVLPAPVFARVDRTRSGVLHDCEAIGYPLFQRDPDRRARHTAELHGTIYQTDEAEAGRLLLREPLLRGVSRPGFDGGNAAGPDGRIGSVWGGLSGALVFHAGQAIGVVVEHHPRQGDAAVQLVAIEQISERAAVDAATRTVAETLGLPAPAALPWAAARPVEPFAGRPPVSWPHRVGVLPPLAEGYQPREDPVLDLHRPAGSNRLAAKTRVLSGLGGIGKTQLAAAYARQLWNAGELDLLVWINASGRDAVLTGYAQAGTDVANPPTDETAQQVAGRFLNWLAATQRRWLVGLDDLADPADLAGWWPTGPAGQVVVTTRRRDASLFAQGRARVEVDLFTAEEALAYLAGRLGAERLDPQTAGLVEDLGRLPLALAQAASYLLDRDLDCAGYRRRLADRRLQLTLPADAAADDYRGTVTATWSLSIERADELAPVGVAHPALSLASVLDSQGIPAQVFTAAPARAYLAAARTAAAATSGGENEPIDPDDAADALRNLHRLSLVTLAGGPVGTVRVHGLVQRAVRESMADAALYRAARAAADTLLEIWPDTDYRPQLALLAQSLRDNTDALQAHCPAALWTPDAHPLLFAAGRSRADCGLLSPAIAYFQQLTGTAERLLGPDHPDTLLSGRARKLLGSHAAC